MPCEEYKQELIEVAATGAELPDAVRRHIEVCDGCRAWLAGEQALYSTIDRELYAVANTEMPAHFVARVQANLLLQPAQSRHLLSTWALLCATAALAVIVGLLGFIRRPQNAGSATRIASTRISVQRPADAGLLEAAPLIKNSRRRKMLTARNEPSASKTRDAEPEVLVAPGEEALLLRFYESARSEANPLRVVAAEGTTSLPLAVEKIVVAEITIESLEQRDDGSK